MLGMYSEAIEKRIAWLRWLEADRGIASQALPHYMDVLRRADTFYMDALFCDLVDHARRDVPSDLSFDARWLLAPAGFLYLAKPFMTPALQADTIKDEAIREDYREKYPVGIPLAGIGWHEAENGHTEFVCFQDRGASFGAWSYFHLRDGYKLAEKIADFERAAGTAQDAAEYIEPEDSTRERYDHPLHEVRWLYSALHLMSERLAIQIQHPTSRAVRRRLERQREQVPEFIKVVTLRRLQQARERDGASADVNWKWQWTVRGHWRNQFYPNEGVHKPKFIDAYFKGPEDKPLKPDTLKLFVAKR